MSDTTDDETTDRLVAWAAQVVAELGLRDPVDPDVIAQILDLAGKAAHAVLRPAAPVTTFLAGLALGSDPDLDLDAVVARIDRLLPH